MELDQPTVHDISVLGLTLHLPVKFISLQQTAKVDFLAFHDVQINGVPISVEEYGHRLVFKKGTGTTLPQPIKVFVPTIRILQIAKRELKGDTNQWRVTGRIFVFGKFRRFGMLHKRAVPVDLDLLFDNPLRQ